MAPLPAQVRIDTVLRRTVGPGVEQFKLVAPTIPWEIHLLKINLKNPYLTLESVLANDKKVSPREKTSKMAARKNFTGHWVVGAINADFFNGDGSPVNVQVSNGEIVRTENGYPALAWTEQKKISFAVPAFNGRVLSGSKIFTVNKINDVRDSNDIVLYNKFNGTSTGVNSSGTEYIISPLSVWRANDTIACVIDSIRKNLASSPIPAGKSVLSAGINIAASMASLKKGDTVKCAFTVMTGLTKIHELLGGRPILLKNGVRMSLDSGSFNITRHPRTAIGFNADTSIVYFMEIDGRQAISKGIDLFELTDLMVRLGITNGMNFDGGGSSAMVVRGAVVNSPSDPEGERAVANALLLVSSAPAGPVQYLEIYPKTAKVYSGNQQQFTVNALDSNYNPVTVTPGSITYRVSKPSIGTVNASGVFTGGNVADTGYVIMELNSKKDSAKVIVTVLGNIQVRPKVCVTDKQLLTAFSIKGYDTDSVEVAVQNSLIQWKCLDTAYGNIDVAGQFQGKKAGTARVWAKYGGKSDTATVYVQIGTGTVVTDSVENIGTWNVTGQNIDSTQSILTLSSQYHSIGNSSLKAAYSFTYTANQYNWFYLNNTKQLYGVPDSIELDIRSDGAQHRLFFDLTDVLNQNVRVMGHKMANNATTFETIRGALPKLTSIIYPLTLKSISLALGSTQVAGQVYQGALHIDNLRVKYPEDPNGITEGKGLKADVFKLYPNYPNPCNPSSRISFHLPEPAKVKLIVYSSLGQEAFVKEYNYEAPGLQEIVFQTSKLASGAYFCCIEAQNSKHLFRAVNKLLVLK